MSLRVRDTHILPIALVGISAALFLAFVYGYPRLFPLIEASSPEHFEKNVAKAMAGGDLRNALRIAQRATRVRRLDPMAYTVYGRTLLECGKENEALAQLNQAVSVQKELVGDAYRETRKPFYFAPARLTLGKYYLEQNKLPVAAVNFELARAYAVLTDSKYADYHAALYQTYAKQGLWARALEFGQPSDQELDGLDSRDLVRIARVCEGMQNWKLAKRLADRLMTREGLAVEAHYLLGRADLAQGHYESSVAHLEQAVSNGHAHAAFFLGTALEKSSQPAEAIQALLRTASEDVYRPCALAKALTLLENLSEDERISTTVTREELLGQLDQEIAEMRLTKRPALFDKYRRFTPVAIRTSETHFASGGRFPVLILWEDGKAPAVDPMRVSFSSSDAGDSLLLLRGSDNLLQLQWVENRVNWESVERLPPGANVVPGWIDIARDWFHLRPDYATEIQKDGTGNSFLDITTLTWFYSVPVRVRDEVGYLLAGRLKGPQGKGGLGWQGLNEKERVVSEQVILNQESSDDWTWQATYMRSQLLWDTIRVQLDVSPNAGTVAFDDVMLVEIQEPDPAL